MSKALVIFGSTTGNTEAVAETISVTLGENGFEVELKNVTDVKVSELGGEYELTVMGASTWGHDEIEFQEDFEPFYEEMMGAEIRGKKVALFGCGDSSYEYFCGAIDLLEERMEDLGAQEVVEALRIDGDPDMAEVAEWTKSLVS